jgi:hypothetical protein
MSASAARTDDNRRTRVSGLTAGQEAADEQVADLDAGPTPEEAVTPEERSTELDGLNFSRLRLDWRSEDARDLDRAEAMVDEVIAEEFGEAFAILDEIWSVVRDPEPDPSDPSRQALDEHGDPIWRTLPNGELFEDWSRLGYAQREGLLFRLTTSCFVWEQRTEVYRFRAMWAKFRWRSEFSNAYDKAFDGDRALIRGQKDTIEHRTARAEIASDEDRLFALLQTYLSRRADAVVRSARAVEQRIKDVTVAR